MAYRWEANHGSILTAKHLQVCEPSKEPLYIWRNIELSLILCSWRLIDQVVWVQMLVCRGRPPPPPVPYPTPSPPAIEYAQWAISLGLLYAANTALKKATLSAGITFPSPLIGAPSTSAGLFYTLISRSQACFEVIHVAQPKHCFQLLAALVFGENPLWWA